MNNGINEPVNQASCDTSCILWIWGLNLEVLEHDGPLAVLLKLELSAGRARGAWSLLLGEQAAALPLLSLPP